MYDPSKVRPQLAAEIIRLARRSEKAGYAVGSTGEQIVGALLNGRADWLPESCPTPLAAIIRLHQGGEEWWHTMLFVNERNWREPIEMYEERL